MRNEGWLTFYVLRFTFYVLLYHDWVVVGVAKPRETADHRLCDYIGIALGGLVEIDRDDEIAAGRADDAGIGLELGRNPAALVGHIGILGQPRHHARFVAVLLEPADHLL